MSGQFQNMRKFTVSLCDALAPETIKGTGFIVAAAPRGLVVTCYHVVRDCGIDPRTGKTAPVVPRRTGWERFLDWLLNRPPLPVSPGRDLPIPLWMEDGRERMELRRFARVFRCFPEGQDDDVVLLEVVGGPLSVPPEAVAQLGLAKGSDGHSFRSYGYKPKLDPYVYGYAYGKIGPSLPIPRVRRWQVEQFQIESVGISGGMSGAAVLDEDRGLVVGLVSATYDPHIDRTMKNPGTSYAVDAQVLSLDPLLIAMHDATQRPAAPPLPRPETAAISVGPAGRNLMDGAPSPLKEWVGRASLLEALTQEWESTTRRVVGLIGRSGEGKSSLARRWLDDVGLLPEGRRPEGVVWWSFQNSPSPGADAFLEAALRFVSDGKVDPRWFPSAELRAHALAGLLATVRYILVLDGFEVVQRQDGDPRVQGQLTTGGMREFLTRMAVTEMRSFCVVTSRSPLLDLADRRAYIHHEVERLSPEGGRELLKRLGMRGRSAQLGKLVASCEGHALSLSLLGTISAQRYEGRVPPREALLSPGSDVSAERGVEEVLRFYDAHLTPGDRRVLGLLSLIRVPASRETIQQVLRPLAEAGGVSAGWLDDDELEAMLDRLVADRLLQRKLADGCYSAHPFVQAYYQRTHVAANPQEVRDIHLRLKAHYLEAAFPTPPDRPVLADLMPAIEAVHHACAAEEYDEALQIFKERVIGADRYVLTKVLGAWDTNLTTLLEFFPDRDVHREPRLSKALDRVFVLNDVGLSLMDIGRMSEAEVPWERCLTIAWEEKDAVSIGIALINLAELRSHIGALDKAAQAASESLEVLLGTDRGIHQVAALAWVGWLAYLRGRTAEALKRFREAGSLQGKLDPDSPFLPKLEGAIHAEFLLRQGMDDEARIAAELNSDLCWKKGWRAERALWEAILGDLADKRGDESAATRHYHEALRIGQSSVRRPILLRAWTGWGCLQARRGEFAAAVASLTEARDLARDGGYQIAEIDARIGLARALRALEHPAEARAEAAYARCTSEVASYHWGLIDPDSLLTPREGTDRSIPD